MYAHAYVTLACHYMWVSLRQTVKGQAERPVACPVHAPPPLSSSIHAQGFHLRAFFDPVLHWIDSIMRREFYILNS